MEAFMRRGLLFAFLLLAACGPKPVAETASSTSPALGACAAQAQAQWLANVATPITISADFVGDECEQGDAVLVMKDAAGAELYRFALPVSNAANTVFAEAKDADTMKKALADWIDPKNNTTIPSTGALPEWAAKDEQPGNAEFPFMPDVSREQYAALRAKNVAMYCHVQGGESMACVIYDEAAKKMSQVGLQRFPG
jgi:hypothetical protein